MKLVHIHTSYKFVSLSQYFKGNLFNDQIIIIQNQIPYNGKFKDSALLFKKNNQDIKKIVKICSEADLVVFYELDYIKSRIALALPEKVKIAWRFFGYELYGRAKHRFLSKKSILALKKDKNKLGEIKANLKSFYSKVIKGKSDKLFYKALNRISFMLLTSKEEYSFLKQYWNSLPDFIQLPHLSEKNLPIRKKYKPEKPVIIVGNSKNIYNNHLDVIELIDKYAIEKNYRFVLLFSYGFENQYTEIIRNAVKNKSYYELIEDFMSIEKYKAFYNKVIALVINSYRQMAGNNIFTALGNGVKVYLNRRNVFYTWMKNEGFMIYTIEDFDADLQNNNLRLTDEITKYHVSQLEKFANKYTIEDFQKEIYNRVI